MLIIKFKEVTNKLAVNDVSKFCQNYNLKMNYELLLLISMGVLLFVIISEIFEWIYSLSIIYEYTYDNDDKEKGPSSWKHMFQSANGRMQSPINLSFKKDPVIVENQLQLVWSRHYSELPLRMDLYNDKYCGMYISHTYF